SQPKNPSSRPHRHRTSNITMTTSASEIPSTYRTICGVDPARTSTVEICRSSSAMVFSPHRYASITQRTGGGFRCPPVYPSSRRRGFVKEKRLGNGGLDRGALKRLGDEECRLRPFARQ